MELRLPSEMGSERTAMAVAASFAQGLGLAQSRVDDLTTAIAEACINAIEHGNRLDRRLDFVVELAAAADRLTVEVSDHGLGGPIPVAAPKPQIEAKVQGLERGRGWGLWLIGQLVDEVEVASSRRGGNRLRMSVRLSPTSRGEQVREGEDGEG